MRCSRAGPSWRGRETDSAPSAGVERTSEGWWAGQRRRGRRTDRSASTGQGLVEFALTLPIFVLLMMGVLEFGFLYNNILTVQYAARQGVSAAAQAGGVDGADCSILKAVERALTAPIDKSRVTSVDDLPVRRERRPGPRRRQHLRPDRHASTVPAPRTSRTRSSATRATRRSIATTRWPRGSTSSASGSATCTPGSRRSARAGPGPCPTGRRCAWSPSSEPPTAGHAGRRWSSSCSSCRSSC